MSKSFLDELFAVLRRHPGAQFSFSFDDQRIFVDTQKKRVFFDEGFSYKAAVAGKHTEFRLLTTLPAVSSPGVSLADFFYEFTLQHRQAQLLAELSHAERFKIKQWPQFVNTANTKAMIRVSAYFSSHMASLQTAAQELPVGMEQLIGFMNAVHAQNLLMFESAAVGAVAVPLAAAVAAVAAEPPPTENTKKLSGLFGRIRARLGI